MIRRNLAPKDRAARSTLLIASLFAAASLTASAASPSMQMVTVRTEPASRQPAMFADAEPVTKPTAVKAASAPRKVKRASGKTWLNPQPEPPMSASKKTPGGTWLNPQPEPPRPDNIKKKLQ